jgi:hypothetical protein
MPKLREPNLLSYIEKVWRERERERERLGITTLCQQCGPIHHHLQTHFSNHEEFCAACVCSIIPLTRNKNNQPISERNLLLAQCMNESMNESMEDNKTKQNKNMGEINYNES